MATGAKSRNECNEKLFYFVGLVFASLVLHCNHPMNLSHLMSHAGLQRLSSKKRPPTKLSFCWRLLNLFSSCHEWIRLKKWARRKMRSLKFEWRSLFLPFSIVMLPVPIRGLKSITRHLKRSLFKFGLPLLLILITMRQKTNYATRNWTIIFFLNMGHSRPLFGFICSFSFLSYNW